MIQAFLRGDQVELHQVMAATEEAGIALEMLIEIRNKFTDAYRTLINMQSLGGCNCSVDIPAEAGTQGFEPIGFRFRPSPK